MSILVISDPHVTAGQDLRRFRWLAGLIEDEQPDAIICLGDFITLDSFSAWEKAGSKTEKNLPSFNAERKAVVEAQELMFAGIDAVNQNRIDGHRKRYAPERILIHGNHEDRYYRWAELNHRQSDIIDFNDVCGFSDFWDRIVPYRGSINKSGILFTHVPHSGSGRPISGVSKTRRAVLEASRPVVFGHGHDLQVSTHGDITGGPANRMSISCPAFMADGNIERYAQGSHSGWSYGCLMVRPQGSDRIPSYDYISMKDLENWYR